MIVYRFMILQGGIMEVSVEKAEKEWDHSMSLLEVRNVKKVYTTSTPYLKFLCKFSRIFFRVYKFRNGGVAGYVEYSGLVQSGK